MIPGFDLVHVIQAVGLFGLMAIIFAESGLLVGFFLPGDTLLFSAGLLAHQGTLGINIHVLVVALFVAAALGDSVGYTFGRRMGPRIFKKQDSLFFHQDNITRAESFYQKYGSLTIVLARFVPVVRTFAPIVAGVAKMPYRSFLLYNLIGALLWTAGVTYLGYFAGAWLEARGIDIDHLILPVIGVVVVITAISPLVHLLREPKSRQALLAKLRLGKRA